MPPLEKPEPPAPLPDSLVSAHWPGPLPPPATLKQFDEVIPGGAERILRMAEAEQAHRHLTDMAVLNADSRAISRGQWLGGVGVHGFDSWGGRNGLGRGLLGGSGRLGERPGRQHRPRFDWAESVRLHVKKSPHQ
jgi:hypothetical protein